MWAGWTRAQLHTGVKVCLYYLSSEHSTQPLKNPLVGCSVVVVLCVCVRWCACVCKHHYVCACLEMEVIPPT